MKLAHMVYFTLKDRSPEAADRLVAACHEYLTGHPGTVYFAAGKLVPDLVRPVNQTDFDVGLHVVFASKADHDAYQVAPRHEEFVAQNKPTWERVRVFDTYVS